MRLLFVHAHPDDESSKGAATAARYAAEGHRVRVVTCTGGERGDILNPRYEPSDAADLAQIRREEMAAAVAALGVEHAWLGFVDSGLPEGDPLPPLPEGCFALQPLDVTVPALVAHLREFRPHVVVTYNEQGGYPHPDHLMTHEVTMRAVDDAASPGGDGAPGRSRRCTTTLPSRGRGSRRPTPRSWPRERSRPSAAGWSGAVPAWTAG